MNFQEMILALQQFWAAQGCVLWNPYNVQVGAGTNNPATLLRVLGPEPWRVAYVEPCIRPDDGRYGENPNRMQRFLQYQVILKPEPGNPQELYLESLAALGIHTRDNDIRFVEDNWQSPPLGAWGLGWEVWLNGQEIAQFTYFQQAAGLPCDPVSVEITYGLERMAMAIQGVDSVWDVCWQGELTYGDVFRDEERAYCQYYFEIADVRELRAVYDTYQKEHERALEKSAVLPAYDYVLKCNHIFNVLDARGAVGVTERAQFFRTMHGMTRACAHAYLAEREALGFPWREKLKKQWPAVVAPESESDGIVETGEHADFLLEIGVEELPPTVLSNMVDHLKKLTSGEVEEQFRLKEPQLFVAPRRLAIFAKELPVRSVAWSRERRGPPAKQAYDDKGQPTAAALGFARSAGVSVDELTVKERDGGEYVVTTETHPGLLMVDELAKVLPKVVKALVEVANSNYPQTMRWNADGIEFARPIRWLVALFGKQVIQFSAAGLKAGRKSRDTRQNGSKCIPLKNASDYESKLKEIGIIANPDKRRVAIECQLVEMAKSAGAQPPEDAELLDEVIQLVEAPTVFRGDFDQRFLALPDVVLTTVMKKHQRYFALRNKKGELLPHFLAVRDGNQESLEGVQRGNEQVLSARFADAQFFYEQDRKQPLEAYLPRLKTLTFHEKLGSMLDKCERLARLAPKLELGFLHSLEIRATERAALLCKADLTTNMVIELTSLQGDIGYIYAKESSESPAVAKAIYEHWLPRHAEDKLPESKIGITLAIADRLDSLVGLIGVGLEAKATADPYGLRRLALGLIQIMLQCDVPLDLRSEIPRAIQTHSTTLLDNTYEKVLEFLRNRYENWLLEQGFPYDAIRCVLPNFDYTPWHRYQDLITLVEWSKRGDWAEILERISRIIRLADQINEEEINEDMWDNSEYIEDVEYELHEASNAILEEYESYRSLETVLNPFYEYMFPIIPRYFDEILVNTKDKKLRDQRQSLICSIAGLFDEVVDLRQIRGF